ncbi:SprT family protein [Oenococcus sicerae]|uniref:SprT family protein n=1 Tax=Oenococcus sicerae TaxID=2203724 RepID=A0AAJ1RDU0_9LACO|nr:SprT family protein [Oenococcus sicerae]MDN6900927.1 SprT family protein [Oenococcus sicerae]
MTQISKLELKALVERLSLMYFGKNFNHDVFFNGHLRSTGGRMVFPKIGSRILKQKVFMEINPKLSDEDLPGIIKHELAHYDIFLTKGIHRENDRDFQNLLKQIDAPRYSPLHSQAKSFYIYRCTAAHHHEYSRHRKINLRKMRCGIDGATLKLVAEKHLK